jgi:hypothetical protein
MVSAKTSQLKPVHADRRIIQRPRLTKALNEIEARTILLLAPAGYGKTTLARQWAKSLNGEIWITLTPAHRDVSTLARDLAREMDELGGPRSSLLTNTCELGVILSAQHVKSVDCSLSTHQALGCSGSWLTITTNSRRPPKLKL